MYLKNYNFREVLCSRLEKIVDSLSHRVLKRANVNAESPLWYMAGTDAAGVKIGDFLSSRDLAVINEPSRPF